MYCCACGSYLKYVQDCSIHIHLEATDVAFLLRIASSLLVLFIFVLLCTVSIFFITSLHYRYGPPSPASSYLCCRLFILIYFMFGSELYVLLLTLTVWSTVQAPPSPAPWARSALTCGPVLPATPVPSRERNKTLRRVLFVSCRHSYVRA